MAMKGRNIRVEWNRVAVKHNIPGSADDAKAVSGDESGSSSNSSSSSGGIIVPASAHSYANTHMSTSVTNSHHYNSNNYTSSNGHDQSGYNNNYSTSLYQPTVAPLVISCYVQFETVDNETRVTEATIREVCSAFGGLTGCFLKSNYISSNGKVHIFMSD
jgi:hypothetical protein